MAEETKKPEAVAENKDTVVQPVASVTPALKLTSTEEKLIEYLRHTHDQKDIVKYLDTAQYAVINTAKEGMFSVTEADTIKHLRKMGRFAEMMANDDGNPVDNDTLDSLL